MDMLEVYLSEQNDKSQEGLVEYVKELFEGKEEKMARTDEGIKVDTPWIQIPSGQSVTGVYQGFDDSEVDKYGNKKFYFTLKGEDTERYISSGSSSFKRGIQDKKIGQKLLIAKEGKMATTKYTITLIV